METVLYGDGMHDDYPAIQALLDTRACEVSLPVPKKEYCISKTLKIHGGQTLKLPRFAVVKLLAQSNCAMLEDDDFSSWKEDVCIDGGIWDMNNAEQQANPYHFKGPDGKTFYNRLASTYEGAREVIAKQTEYFPLYSGMCMRFCRIKRFVLKNLTFKNPVVYGVQLGFIEHFTVSDIIFDYRQGAPKLWNMDGVHLEGGCKNGVIRNLQGTCHDDTVALTSDDFLYGPIENIVVEGIFAEGAHSAVRLLSHGIPVKNITIRDVFGSFYVYCIGLTKYHGGEDERGVMENITIENIHACACEGTADVGGGKRPLLWVQDGVDIKNLRISSVFREEKTYPTATVQVDKNATVDGCVFTDIYLKNCLGTPIKLLELQGEIKNLTKNNIREN